MATVEASIDSKLRKIIEIKTDIAKAIKEQGGSVSDSDTFESYADKIKALTPTGGLEELNVTSNGTYTPSSGKSGYSKVVVNISSSGSGSGGSGSGSGSGGSGIGGSDDETGSSITWKVNFYKKESNAQDNEIIQTVDVENHGEAIYTGPEPIKDPQKDAAGNIIKQYEFNAWNPPPTDIQKDTDCYPTFKDPEAEIELTWAQIVEDGGSSCGLGQYKTLNSAMLAHVSRVDVTTNSDKSKKVKYTFSKARPGLVMEKVYSNESDSTSTWITKSIVSGNQGSVSINMPYKFRKDAYSHFKTYAFSTQMTDSIYEFTMTEDEYNSEDKTQITWKNSDLRDYLNSIVIPRLEPAVASGIKSVSKYSSTVENDIRTVTSSTERLWLLSVSEVKGPNGNYEGIGCNYSQYSNHSSKGFILRSIFEKSKASGETYNFAAASSGSYANLIGMGISNVDPYVTNNLAFGFCL